MISSNRESNLPFALKLNGYIQHMLVRSRDVQVRGDKSYLLRIFAKNVFFKRVLLISLCGFDLRIICAFTFIQTRAYIFGLILCAFVYLEI